jgi:phage terminase large subunit-like protein
MQAELSIPTDVLNPFAAGLFDFSQLPDFTPEQEGFEGLPALEELAELIDYLDDVQLHELEQLLELAQARPLMPHQIVPWWRTDWMVMLLVGGRGVGKTVCGAGGCIEHLRDHGPNARIGVGAPTNADARDTCAEGPTGLIKLYPNEFTKWNRSLGEARHVGGGYVKFMGTEKPARWNGGNWSMLWFDELALCNQKAWDDANLALRLGRRPRALATTTPKHAKWVRTLAEQPSTYVPHYLTPDGKVRFPTTFDNPFLPAERVEWLKNKYINTRVGRRELLGLFLGEVEGAMWQPEIILHELDYKKIPRLTRRIVAVDPAGSAARKKADELALQGREEEPGTKNADTGITVAAKGADGRFYVIACFSGQWTPAEWGALTIKLFHEYKCDRIVAEKTYGGLMVESTIRQIDQADVQVGRLVPSLGLSDSHRRLSGRQMPIKLVNATQGKHIRAEPVVALYEQRKVTHLQNFVEAEDQMCAFIDADHNEGADMVDSLVWNLLELAGLTETGETRIVPGGAGTHPFMAKVVGGMNRSGPRGRIMRKIFEALVRGPQFGTPALLAA